jgi:hypothetical protein
MPHVVWVVNPLDVAVLALLALVLLASGLLAAAGWILDWWEARQAARRRQG